MIAGRSPGGSRQDAAHAVGAGRADGGLDACGQVDAVDRFGLSGYGVVCGVACDGGGLAEVVAVVDLSMHDDRAATTTTARPVVQVTGTEPALSAWEDNRNTQVMPADLPVRPAVSDRD
jgi:hypothetical protein